MPPTNGPKPPPPDEPDNSPYTVKLDPGGAKSIGEAFAQSLAKLPQFEPPQGAGGAKLPQGAGGPAVASPVQGAMKDFAGALAELRAALSKTRTGGDFAEAGRQARAVANSVAGGARRAASVVTSPVRGLARKATTAASNLGSRFQNTALGRASGKVAAGAWKLAGAGLGAAGGGAMKALSSLAGAVPGPVAALAKVASVAQAVAAPVRQVTAEFTKFFGVSSVLNSALRSQSSGAQTAAKASRLLGESLGQVFMPANLAVSTALTAFARALSGPMNSVMGKFAEWLMPKAMSATAAVIDAFDILADNSDALYKAFDDLAQYLPTLPDAFDAVVNGLTMGIPGMMGVSPSKMAGQAYDALPEARRDEGGRTRGQKITAESMKMSILEMERSMMKPAQSTTLANIGRDSQLAALGASPYENEMLRIQREQLATMKASLAKLEGNAPAQSAPNRQTGQGGYVYNGR